MKDTVSISIDDFSIPEDVTAIDIYGKEIMVKASLGLTETIGFVDSVSSTVLDPETGEYRPENLHCGVQLHRRPGGCDQHGGVLLDIRCAR